MSILGLSWSDRADRDQTYAGSATLATGNNKGLYIFRDLTINAGVVLSIPQSVPTIIVCRDLTFGDTSSEIRAMGRGPSGSAGAQGATLGGDGGLRNLSGLAAGEGLLAEWFVNRLLSAGAAGRINEGAGNAGAAVAPSFSWQLLPLLQQVEQAGGGGGSGGSRLATGTAGAGGTVGGDGTDAVSSGTGGGGSGIGGGGSGGIQFVGSGGGSGGAGGGIILVICRRVLTAAGKVTADGLSGTDAGSNGGGGGGGGGGYAGLIAVNGGAATPTLSADGGAAGTGGTGPGGAGGAGKTQLIGFEVA